MDNGKKPRILIFSLAYFPFVGGAEIAVKEITDRLSSPTCFPDGVVGETVGAPTHSGVGVDFDLITYKFRKEWSNFEKIGNVNVYRIKCPNKFFFVFKSWTLAKKLNKKNNYSASWAIMASYSGFSALFFKFSNPKVPFLLTLQEGDSEEHILKRVGIFYPIWKLIFKKANYIQAISNFLADFGRRHGAICPIKIVPNGVDLKKYDADNANDMRMTQISDETKISNPQIREESANPHHIIITTSRLVYKNGIDILIRAIAELKRKDIQCPMDIECPRIELLILGSGPEDQNLKKLAQNLDIQNEVIFTGHIEPDKIPEYLYQADIFVRPSRSEGLGNSFLEAMAAGLPVIGTRVGGIPDFLNSYDVDNANDMRMTRISDENGIFCEIDNPIDLAMKISLLLDNGNLCKQLGENGKRLVFEKYSWDGISKKIQEIFDILI